MADFDMVLHMFSNRYYALEVSYFKSSLDRKLLELLWNKYWVNTLSSSSLLTVSTFVNLEGDPKLTQNLWYTFAFPIGGRI